MSGRAADDHAADTVGDSDGFGAGERPAGVGVEQLPPTQSGPVEALDPLPVRVPLLAAVVVVACHDGVVRFAAALDRHGDDVGFP